MASAFDPATTIISEIERVEAGLVEAATGISSATLHEAAGKIGSLPSAIKPACPGFTLYGPAVTVNSPPGDNLWIHRAIYVARPGDILVISVGDGYEHGYWGEVMSTAAKAVGLAGMVIDGCVRDSALLSGIGFPVFSRGLCIRGTGKDFGAYGSVNLPIQIGDVTVQPGDLIVGDGDGVVSIPRVSVSEVIKKSRDRDLWEAGICRRLEAGETTLDIFGWK